MVCPTQPRPCLLRCTDDSRGQCISRHGVDPQNQHILSPASEECVLHITGAKEVSQVLPMSLICGNINFLLPVILYQCINSWWRHQMETFSALLAICAENSPVTGEFPAQRPVTRSFDVLFDLCLNKRLSKQSWGWWFETPPHPLWRHCIVIPNYRSNALWVLKHNGPVGLMWQYWQSVPW